jgi:hypothetical protein
LRGHRQRYCGRSSLSRKRRIFNLGGGSEVGVLSTIALIEKITGRKAKLRQNGDVRDTKLRLDRAKDKPGCAPKVGLEQG